ncbi:MAG: TVP38/TMEM64 family protein [bacterium]|nr:TVP38/TMEM64 family protein [bacterium]
MSGRITAFALWVNGLGIWGPIAFMIGYAVATVAFVPGSFLTLAGGAIFGLGWGTVYVFCAAAVGSSGAFLISRYLARRAVERKLGGNEKFATIDQAVGAQGLKIVTLLRLSPAFPFNLLNYGLGLTRVRFTDYLLASFGMLPGTFLYVYYGKAVGDVAALAAGERAEQGTEQWIFLGLGLVATIAVTAVVTRIARRALKEATDD